MKPGQNTRQTLIAKIRNQHDEAAWDDFVNFYRPYIATVITKMGVIDRAVDDVVQKVIMTLWKKLPDFEYMPDKCKFRTWMNNVTQKEVYNHFRTEGRYNKRVEKAATMTEWAPSDDLPDIYSIAEEEWKVHVTKIAWNNIQEGFTGKGLECFTLFSKGMSVDDICSQLDLKANTAYVLRGRVTEKLAREVRRLNDELS